MKMSTLRISILLVILFITNEPRISNNYVNAVQAKGKDSIACNTLKNSLNQLNSPKPKPKSIDRDPAFDAAKQEFSDLNFSSGNNMSFVDRGRALIGIWNKIKKQAVTSDLKSISQRNVNNWYLKIQFNQTPRGPEKAKLSPKMIASDTQAMQDEVTASKLCGFTISGDYVIEKKR